jgi:hypothetical protein
MDCETMRYKIIGIVGSHTHFEQLEKSLLGKAAAEGLKMLIV